MLPEITIKITVTSCEHAAAVFGKRSVSNSAFPMNIFSIRDENRMVSWRLVQQLSPGKSQLTLWSLAKREEKTGHCFC